MSRVFSWPLSSCTCCSSVPGTYIYTYYIYLYFTKVFCDKRALQLLRTVQHETSQGPFRVSLPSFPHCSSRSLVPAAPRSSYLACSARCPVRHTVGVNVDTGPGGVPACPRAKVLDTITYEYSSVPYCNRDHLFVDTCCMYTFSCGGGCGGWGVGWRGGGA